MSKADTPTPPSAGGSRYTRTNGGLLAALLVTVLAVLAFTAFRSLFTDNEPTPVRTVDYQASVKQARADGQLLVMAPKQLPAGWRATSATYTRGVSPSWHLGMLTGQGKYVGVDEARVSIEDLVKDHVDIDAERGKDVTIAGETWQTWTDAGGDYAVARSSGGGKSSGPSESWIVVGTAKPAQVRELAGSLVGVPPATG